MHVAVIGAQGAIGQAMVQHWLQQPDVTMVYGFARKVPLAIQHPKLYAQPMDILEEDSIAAALHSLPEGVQFERVVVTTGLLHGSLPHGESLMPEKRLKDLNREALLHLYAVNAIGPMLVAKYLLPYLPRDKKAVFAVLSARVGSISDNQLGGWYGYRAAKAGLNMLLKTFAIEAARTHKHLVVAGLHPGTVDTPLSAPFHRNVAVETVFSPARSARYLLEVMECLAPAQTGRVWDYAGQEVPA